MDSATLQALLKASQESERVEINYAEKLKGLEEEIDLYTNPENQAKLAEAGLLERIQDAIPAMNDQREALMVEVIKQGGELTFEQSEFLQRRTNEVDTDEVRDLQGQDQVIAIVRTYAGMMLNSDGKLSESEVETAKEEAAKAFEIVQKTSSGELTPTEGMLAIDKQFDELNTQQDVMRLLVSYVETYREKLGDLPDKPRFGGLFGGNDEYKAAVEEIRNSSAILEQPIEDDKNIKEVLEKLGQAKLVDDMQPYGDTSSKSPTVDGADQSAEKAATR